MNKHKHYFATLLYTLFLLLPILLYSDTPAIRARSFEFTYTTQVRYLPKNAKNISLWIPLPVPSEYQDISDLKIDTAIPYTVTKDEKYNNQFVHIALKEPKTDSLSVTLTFHATRREHVASFKLGAVNPATTKPASKVSLQPFLRPTQKVVITPQIKEMAKKVIAGRKTPLEKMRALYDYVASNMKYDKSGTGWGNGDVEFCLLEKRGNCSDFHSLYSALAISVGIPTRFAIGFPIPTDKNEGEIGGYHCWAESYIEGQGWIPVDISEAQRHPEKHEYFFGAHDENRVQFTVGRDLVLSPSQKGKPINFLIYPYVEVDGKTYTNVEKKFYFKDTKPSI